MSQDSTPNASHPPGVDGIAQMLSRVGIFASLSPAELEPLAHHCEWLSLPPRTRIVREGELGDGLFVIHSGFVAIVRGSEGQSAFIATLGPGDYFGEASLFHEAKRIANVDTQTEAQMLRIERGEFDRYLEAHPASANRILRAMLKQVFFRLDKTTHELQFERRQSLAQDAIDQIFK